MNSVLRIEMSEIVNAYSKNMNDKKKSLILIAKLRNTQRE